MTFDPYRKWLGIPSTNKNPNFYNILGIEPGENDADVIRSAIEQRRIFLQSKRGEGHDSSVTTLLGLIEEAASTLLVPEFKHGYDRHLRLQPNNQRTVGRKSYILPSWMESRVVRVYGEGNGIVGDLFGVVCILLGAFGLMAWWSFRLQSGGEKEAQSSTPVPPAAASTDKAVNPQLSKPEVSSVALAESAPEPQKSKQAIPSDSGNSGTQESEKTPPPAKPMDNTLRSPLGWQVASGPKHPPVDLAAWQEDTKTGIIESKPIQNSELFSVQEYTNFDLEFDYRFVSGEPVGQKGSGVVIRTKGWNAQGLNPRGIEIDLPGVASDNGARGVGALIAHEMPIDVPADRKFEGIFRPLVPVPQPSIGEWCHVNVSCVADHVDVSVNNRLVNSADGIAEIAGPIAFRCKESAVQFKDIKIKEVTVADKIGLLGTFQIQWKEANGKTGLLEYEFLRNLTVVRAGQPAGKLSLRKGQVWLDFDAKERGSVLLKDITDESFAGNHTWQDGKKSTWSARRKR